MSDIVLNDRQDILSGIVEHALSGVQGITGVIRSWDFFPPGVTAQPLAPFLVVTVNDDEELGIGFGLFTATVQVDLAVNWQDTVRASFDSVRRQVRSLMQSLQGYAFGGLTVDGVQEQASSTPEVISPTGDVTLAQSLTFRVWFSFPSPSTVAISGMTALPPPPFQEDDEDVPDPEDDPDPVDPEEEGV